jgi:hypothetical protein
VTYGARVPCTCVVSKPVQEVRADVVVDVDACGVVTLEPSGSWSEEWEEAASRWAATWCPHEDFALAEDFDVNVFAMAAFRDAVHDVGGLPVLQSRLPRSNEGCIPKHEVRLALEELALFRRKAAGRPLHRLIESETGSVLRGLAMSADGVLATSGASGTRLGFDGHGFFVLEDRGPRPHPTTMPRNPGITVIRSQPDPPERPENLVEVFRARRVRQIQEGSPTEPNQAVRFIDLDTGADFISPIALTSTIDVPDGSGDRFIPEFFHVDTISEPDDWFDFILVPLGELLRIAHEHGSTVAWE